MARRYASMKAGKLKHTANHIREWTGTEEELRALGASFVNRPVNPIICLPDMEVVDGNRRLAGVLLVAGPDVEVPVCITDEQVDESAKLEIMIQSAIHTRGLSAYEEFVGASQWMERNPGATAEQLGERIGRKPSMMSRMLSLSRCVPAVKEAAASGQLGVTEWYELSKCPEQRQQELLAARLSGQVSSRDQLAQAARKQRSGSAPTVRASKIKCQLASGVCVVVSGDEMTLDEMIEALAEAAKEAKKARDQGLDAKTFQSVMRDRARAG